jgi:hypothetical protein
METFSVQKINGDSNCLFRSLAILLVNKLGYCTQLEYCLCAWKRLRILGYVEVNKGWAQDGGSQDSLHRDRVEVVTIFMKWL